MTILCSLEERYCYLIHVPYIQRGKVHWLCKTGKVVSCTVQTRRNRTPKQTQSWPWVCFGSFLFYICVCSGFNLGQHLGFALCTEVWSRPSFYLSPLIYSKYRYICREIWSFFSSHLLVASEFGSAFYVCSRWVCLGQPLQTLKWQRKKTRGLIVFGWLCVRFGLVLYNYLNSYWCKDIEPF